MNNTCSTHKLDNGIVTIFQRDNNRNSRSYRDNFDACGKDSWSKSKNKKRNKYTGEYKNSVCKIVPETAIKSCPCFYHHQEFQAVDIPVRLIRSQQVYNCNDRMNKQNTNVLNQKTADKRINSWGRILKDQNPPVRDVKKTVIVPPTQNKLRTKPTLPQKDLRTTIPAMQNVQKTVKSKPDITKEPFLLNRLKSSSRTIRSRSETKSTDSGTSITGESIMLIDRSAQCSTVNMDMDPNAWNSNYQDLNQAGDNGLAFFNPVRTLNFLVRELRGKVSEGSEDENMMRIIRDMENTVSRLTKSTSPYGTGATRDSWNTLISEADLKCVLELLQSVQKPKAVDKQVSEAEKNTVELQTKLEETCNKLEEMCRLLEKAASTRLKDDKMNLVAELNDKTSLLEASAIREKQYEDTIAELRLKNEEQKKVISQLKESHNKYVALNSILSEQLQDAEKKNQQLTTEMQFLVLEREKNFVLMKCKDNDLQEMRNNLEEIKELVVQHLRSFQLGDGPGTALEAIPSTDQCQLLDVTAISTVTNEERPFLQRPICSSPAVSTSPAPEDDESWRKVSNVLKEPRKPVPPQVMAKSKAVCIKESLKSIFNEMRKQAKDGNSKSIQDLLHVDDPSGMSNWSNDSDDEVHSNVYTLSDADTNFSK